HVELSGLGAGTGRVIHRQHHVRLVDASFGHRHRAAPEWRQDSRLRQLFDRAHPSTELEAWISWSEITSGAPRRAAEMARAAAIAPAIVVMHGIPREIAAVRISYPSVRAPV